MIRAVLLDLDGTLLDTRLDQFIPQYIRAFAAFMSPWMPAEAFQEALMAGTRAMVATICPGSRRRAARIASGWPR